MTVDEIARRAGAELREDVLSSTDVERGLVALERRSRRRRGTRLAAGAVAAALVLVAAVAGWQGTRPVTGPPPPPADLPAACSQNPDVTCPGGRLVHVAGPSAYELDLPGAFVLTEAQTLAPGLVDVFQEGARAGVTVVEDAGGVGAPDRPTDARALASWIAERPFLAASAPERTLVHGRPAWVVDVRLGSKALTHRRDLCNESQPHCRALLTSRIDPVAWEVGPWTDRLSRYYVLDAPGARVTVLWSWAFGGDQQAMARNDALARSFTYTADE